MNKTLLTKHPHTSTSESAGIIDQSLHHHTMSFQQILYAERIQRRIEFVGSYGVLHLLDLFDRSHHVLAVDDVAHFILGQRIALDGQRRMDGLDAVCLTQTQTVFLFQSNGIALYMA